MDGSLITSPAMLVARYEDTVKAIVSCRAIDEAKFFADRAIALEALAKVQKDRRMEREAKAERLWAFRKMGELARVMRPGRSGGVGGGQSPGVRSLLLENGLTPPDADAASGLAKMAQSAFDALVALPRPPSPMAAYRFRSRDAVSENWKNLCDGPGLPSFRSWTRKYPARELAMGLSKDEGPRARIIVKEVQDWLDEFEQYLPKDANSET